MKNQQKLEMIPIEPQPVLVDFDKGLWQIEYFILPTDEVEPYLWYNIYVLELGNSTSFNLAHVAFKDNIWYWCPLGAKEFAPYLVNMNLECLK